MVSWQSRRRDWRISREAFDGRRVDGKTLSEIARRPETTIEAVRRGFPERLAETESALIDRVMNDCRYESFVRRAEVEIRRQKAAESADPRGSIPGDRRAASGGGGGAEAFPASHDRAGRTTRGGQSGGRHAPEDRPASAPESGDRATTVGPPAKPAIRPSPP